MDFTSKQLHKGLTMKLTISMLFILSSVLVFDTVSAAPIITGSPKIITPKELLDWPQDTPQLEPYLTEPTSNRLNDLHGEIGQCDIVLSTSGSYYMALKDLWQNYYLPTYRAEIDIKNWFYTTSSPIAIEQLQNNFVQFGNIAGTCRPQVVVAPAKVINQLIALGLNEGTPVPIVIDYGNVILIKKGNPKHIQDIWDLARENVSLVTPNPIVEPLVFGNFSGSIYNIAASDSNPPENMTAGKLFNSIFNDNTAGQAAKSTNDDYLEKRTKWVSGKRIAHREIPFMIANGYADAGIIMYHQAAYITHTFPDQFDWIPLGGTKEFPTPVTGNQVSTMLAIRIKGEWTPKQTLASEALMNSFMSDEFTKILTNHGLRRP